jgi:coproporphyrinogen III oxidase
VGGIFLDDHCSGDWERDFAMIQDIGRAFLPAWAPLVSGGWVRSGATRSARGSSLHRGLYAEFKPRLRPRAPGSAVASGHDPEAVLMSLPPLAMWA